MRNEVNSGLSARQLIELFVATRDSRRVRERSQTFVIEGIRNFLAAVDNGWHIQATVFSERLLTSGIVRSKVRALRRSGVLSFNVTPEQFRTLSGASRVSGIAAFVQQRYSTLQAASDPRRYVAVESIQSPGNLGSLVRSIAASGSAGIVALNSSVDPFDNRAIRGSMGTLFQLRVIRASLEELAGWSRDSRTAIVGACADGDVSCFDYAFPQRCVLALGHERRGLSHALRDICATSVRIPMMQGIDSLNIAVAGSILLYQALGNDERG